MTKAEGRKAMELGGITINVGVNISEETIGRCCQIMQMYLADHPDRVVKSMQGEYPIVWIEDLKGPEREEKHYD